MRTLRRVPWRVIPAWLAGNRLKILMYHSISDNPFDRHAVSPTLFQEQMCFLRSKRVISLAEALSYLHAGCVLKNVYVITFDDALLDFYTHALPVLRELNYPATIFVPTGLVGGAAVWDSCVPSKPLMTWEQMTECQRYQISFGSHTVNHIRLTECTDDVAREELLISYKMLCDRFDTVIPALAYPGGYYDSRVARLAQSAGYTCAFTASSRWGNGPETDLFRLRRQKFTL